MSNVCRDQHPPCLLSHVALTCDWPVELGSVLSLPHRSMTVSWHCLPPGLVLLSNLKLYGHQSRSTSLQDGG